MTVRLLAALPDKIHNGLARLPAPELGREYLIVSRVRLARHELIDDGDASDDVWKLSLEHVEIASEDDEPDLRLLLTQRLEERRADGQLAFDDVTPSIIDELLAELSELSDDLNVDEQELIDEFETHYGVPPAGCRNEIWLREFIHAKKRDLTLPPRIVEDVPLPGDEPVHTSQTPAGVGG